MQRKRSTPMSALGPPSWKEIPPKHREVLTITRDPPGNGRMLLKMEKHVNACVIAVLISAGLSSESSIRKANKNALAHGVSCGRLASFAVPLM
jgi:hypothetical protein